MQEENIVEADDYIHSFICRCELCQTIGQLIGFVNVISRCINERGTE